MARPLVILMLAAAALRAAPAGGLGDALALALRGAGVADSLQAAALRVLVDEGRAQGGAEASSWALLDLWLKAEWEDAADLPAARAAFLRAWPGSRYRPAADWFQARWHLRRGDRQAAAALAMDLAGGAADARWRRAGVELLDQLRAGGALALDSLASTKGPDARRWLGEEGRRCRLHRRLGLVAPLTGSDAAWGQAMSRAAAAALAPAGAAPESRWELRSLDCQSDPLLARELLVRAAGDSLDAVLWPGEPAYLAAAAGLDAPCPVVVADHGGPALSSLGPALLQFDLDPAAQGRLMADLVQDSLGAAWTGTLAPATRPARRLVQAYADRLAVAGRVESAQEQWYYPGARDLTAQMENLSLFGDSFAAPGVWLVAGAEREGAALRRALSMVPARDRVVGDGALLAALLDEAPAELAGRLLVVTAWLPPAWARAEGLAGAWDDFRRDLWRREEREPSALESRVFAAADLVRRAAEAAGPRALPWRDALAGLPGPGLFGPGPALADSRAAGAWLLGWDGRAWRLLGNRVRAREERAGG